MDDLKERLRTNALDECDEAIARIEALECLVKAADALADALESSGNVTERHSRALNSLVSYRALRALAGDEGGR